jgi:hypothetical protein
MNYIHPMKYNCLALFGLTALSASAQTKEQDEKTFLDALNKLVHVTRSQHWAYDDPFTVDSAFHITGDSISATFSYKNDTMSYRIRYAAPVLQITEVVHDIYLILQFNTRSVSVYEQVDGKDWVRFDKRSYLHIGEADHEDQGQMKLKAAIGEAWLNYAAWFDE